MKKRKKPLPKNQKPKMDRRRILMAVLAGVMALLLLLPMLATILGGASAVTQSEIDALKGKQAESQARQQELKDQLAEIKEDQAAAQQQRQILVEQLEAINAELDNINEQIAWYDSEIAQKELEREEAVAREEEQYTLLCARVRAMEEDGYVSYWSILFNASSFADMLDRLADVGDIMDYDQAVMDQLIATRQEIERIKAELEEARADQEDAKNQQEAKQAEQQAKVAEAQALLDKINADVDEVNRQLDAEDAAAAAIQAQITKKQKEMEAQRQQNNVVLDPAQLNTSSGYRWPLPASNMRLTSAFGYRVDPITGKASSHTGIDIAASSGTTITACKGGQVITSVYGSGAYWSYGNYVVIDHGDGTTTLYAHMSSRAVSEGQIVTQGQVIGYVGSTGRATGPHLHLEVRVNGTRTNPEKYFPELYNSFIRAY